MHLLFAGILLTDDGQLFNIYEIGDPEINFRYGLRCQDLLYVSKNKYLLFKKYGIFFCVIRFRQ